MTTIQIFLSYASEDRSLVDNLYNCLSEKGYKPWMDHRDMLPGEQWEYKIKKALSQSHFFIACLTNNSVNKRGWIQRELKTARDNWQFKLDDDIY
ncbi:MAG TPA: toll/interleukin-1 receptor domain-containing protein, partial [Thermodesulfovibrionia bacterium]|nr:toll/interleukin-1 receptor domain-containing protein [Thermodesulfovibrionia bacterium]